MEGGTLGKAIELHENAATITLWLAIITSIVYCVVNWFKYSNKWIKVASVLLFAALIGGVSRTAYLGGQLVYNHGAGVELALPNFNENESGLNP